jgi:predicted metal-dependent RNase
MEILEQIKEIVHNTLPEKCQITKIEMEGPEIAIYTKNYSAFLQDENLVPKIAFELKKKSEYKK